MEELPKHWKTACPCCDAKLLPCPFCGSEGVIYGENSVGCSEVTQCGGEVNFGHWCGEEDGIPAVHYVVQQWNTRVSPANEQNAARESKSSEFEIIGN